MNRLILIGNGFDLAHGLKTGYNDFILWYLKQCFASCYTGQGYSDDLITIERTNQSPIWDAENYISLSIDSCYQKNEFESLIENNWFTTPFNAWIEGSPFEIRHCSDLLKTLLLNCSASRWVDIENEFYVKLKVILKNSIVGQKESLLTELNKSLKCIIDNLEGYLTLLTQADYIEEYMHIFTTPILKAEVHNADNFEEGEPKVTTILNFNYTSTMKPYLEWFSRNSERPIPEVNFIHGGLNDKQNPLVFGFGDELDDDYYLIEREKVKGYFEYIKSFWYFRTSNYRHLVTFIESEPYQIYILGHSCGLSDRTMLNMIFEHDNCKSIKIFYHGTKERNNFVSITHELARHFKNKDMMRKKIVSFDKSLPMPQYK